MTTGLESGRPEFEASLGSGERERVSGVTWQVASSHAEKENGKTFLLRVVVKTK